MKTSGDSTIINAFSIDVEGFVESNRQSFHIPDKYISKSKENDEIERNTDVVLETLAEAGIKGTFFFLGRLAKDIPSIIKKTANAGHEIGCHNYAHLRVFGINKNEFREKIKAAKQQLEDVSAKSVYGFRAPDFSITEASLWALDILKEAGFVYDSSIYPSDLHDVYGIKNAQSHIHKLPNGLIEVPMSTVKIFGKRIPFGGGGYFRLYPLWLTRFFIKAANRRKIPCISYIHPYEVGPVIPQISELSSYRKFRHYYNCKNGRKRTGKFIRRTRFGTILDVLQNNHLVE